MAKKNSSSQKELNKLTDGEKLKYCTAFVGVLLRQNISTTDAADILMEATIVLLCDICVNNPSMSEELLDETLKVMRKTIMERLPSMKEHYLSNGYMKSFEEK